MAGGGRSAIASPDRLRILLRPSPTGSASRRSRPSPAPGSRGSAPRSRPWLAGSAPRAGLPAEAGELPRPRALRFSALRLFTPDEPGKAEVTRRAALVGVRQSSSASNSRRRVRRRHAPVYLTYETSSLGAAQCESGPDRSSHPRRRDPTTPASARIEFNTAAATPPSRWPASASVRSWSTATRPSPPTTTPRPTLFEPAPPRMCWSSSRSKPPRAS